MQTPTLPVPFWALVLGGIALVLVVFLSFCTFVPNDDMAPSLYAGDFVLILPVDPAPGDVVALVDPLEPGRWTLRRVKSIGGTVSYEDSSLRINDDPEQILEMGKEDTFLVTQEGGHLCRHLLKPIRWEMAPVTVPTDHVFLAADARDEAVDSRWWGPLPLQAVQGVVKLRIGSPRHPWRSWWES